MRRLTALLTFMLAATPASAWDSPVPDVVLYCTRPLAGSCHALARAFRAETGTEVHVFLNSATGLAGLVRHRARADLVLADRATIDTLAQGKFVDPATIHAIGQDPFVLVAHDGAPQGDPKTLLASHTLTLPDPTTAASFDAPAVLHAVLGDAPAPNMLGVADSPNVTADVSETEGALGLTTATDAKAAHLPALTLAVPPLPIAAAIVTLRQSRNTASLLAFAQSPKGQDVLHRSGLEAAP